jgi:dihydroorotate dehydrogenase (fumarate)
MSYSSEEIKKMRKIPSNPSYRLMNAAGCHSSTAEELENLLRSECAVIVTKTCTAQPRIGNPEPHRYLDDWGAINSVGLKNPGYRYYLGWYVKHRQEILSAGKEFIISIIEENPSELLDMLKEIQQAGIVQVELNFSCPNLADNCIIGRDPESCETYLEKLAAFQPSIPQLQLGIKLPPYSTVTEMKIFAELINRYSSVITFVTSRHVWSRIVLYSVQIFIRETEC